MRQKKQQPAFDRCLSSALDRMGQVWDTLFVIMAHRQLGHMEDAYKASFDAANHAEKLANLCRELPAYTGNPKAPEMIRDSIRKNFPVEIGFTREGWFCLRIPMLLPKKNKGSATYIGEPLFPAMKEFWEGKNPVRYPDNVIVFRHVYKRERPERQYRDHDNIELNKVLDIVALYVMVDDSPLRCRHYYCSAPGVDERTEVYVVPRRDFRKFLEQESGIPGEGVTLFENLS